MRLRLRLTPHMPEAAPMNPTLMALLDAGAAHDIEFDGGLSNHLPMALGALAALGADDAHLERYAASYSIKLRAAPPAAAWPGGEPWASRFGDGTAWPAYRQLFAEWLTYESTDDVLAQVLPQLMPGCGAAAFHGLIRTAYAVQARHAGELADALAYWACRYMALPAVPERKRTTADLQKVLAALPIAPVEARFITTRMRAAAAAPGFAAAVARLRIDDTTLPALAQHAAQLYASTGDFTVLHLVTSAHALRVLLPFTPEPLLAVRSYWQAYAAGYAATSAQAETTAMAKTRATTALQDWPSLVAAALASDDEHVIKLMHSGREEGGFYGNDVFRRAASRAVAQS